MDHKEDQMTESYDKPVEPDPTAVVVVGTIDITPTWRGLLPALMALVENSDAEGRSYALGELNRMAQIADLYVAEHG